MSLSTCFSNRPSGPLAEVMSPATINATNEPEPSNNVCASPGHAYVDVLQMIQCRKQKNPIFHSKVFLTFKLEISTIENFLLYEMPPCLPPPPPPLFPSSLPYIPCYVDQVCASMHVCVSIGYCKLSIIC